MEKNFSKAQQEAKAYVESHGLEKLIGDMLNSLVYAKDPCPPIFMIKYLANIVSSDELASNDIHIGAHPSPSSIHLEKVVSPIKEEDIRKSETEFVESPDRSELNQETREKIIKADSGFTENKEIPSDVPGHQTEEDIIKVKKDEPAAIEPIIELVIDRPIEVTADLPLESVPREVKEEEKIVDAKIDPQEKAPTEEHINPPVEAVIEVKTDQPKDEKIVSEPENKIDPPTETKPDPPVEEKEERKIETVEEIKSNTDVPSDPVVPTEAKEPQPTEVVSSSEINPPVVGENLPPT